jgi:hypothetical protein
LSLGHPTGRRAADAGLPLPDLLLLLAAALIVVVPALDWVHRWLVLPTGDGAYHALNILTFQELLLKGQGLWGILRDTLAYSDVHAYPPLGYLVPASLGALLGGLDLTGLASLQILWVPITSTAVYFLARGLFEGSPSDPGRGRRIALISSCWVALDPVMRVYVPDFLLELPTTAMLMVALAVVASNPGMERTRPALLAGVAVAGVLLTKWTALFYLPPALLYVSFRTLGPLPREIRMRTLQILGLLILGLAGAALLVTRFPPAQDPVLGWFRAGQVLAMLGSLGAGCLALARLARRRLGAGPALNLVLAALLASFLAAPFYLFHARTGLESASQQVARTTPEALEHSEDLLQAPSLLGESLGRPVALVLAASLIWLAAAGPRGSFALVGATLVSILAVRQVMTLLTSASFDFRYILPGFPLEILVVVACLQSIRQTRALAAAVLAGLGLWYGGSWLAGDNRPEAPGHRGEIREGHPETLSPLLQDLAEVTGPGTQAVWTLTPRYERVQYAAQVLALLEGHPLVFRDWDASSLPAWTPVTRMVHLLDPQLPMKELNAMSRGRLEDSRRAWILILGQSRRLPELPPLPGQVSPPLFLPAPRGMEARLHLFQGHGPGPRP